MKHLKQSMLIGFLSLVSACSTLSSQQAPLANVTHHGDPFEKVVGFLLVFGIPIALGVDCILLVVYGASLGELGEPMMVTQYVIEVIENLTGGGH